MMSFDPVQEKKLLSVEHLFVAFNERPILEDVSLNIWSDQIVSIVGPNGAGKTTILKAVGGLIRPVRGRILFEGEQIESLSVREIVQRGVVYVPEGMSVFPQMTVLENLEVGAYLNRSKLPEKLEAIFKLFPELRKKRKAAAGTLSGGQKRMVVLARGLMAGARLLLLDDPFLGLSPGMVAQFCEAFRSLRNNGVTLFIAGQHVRRILSVANTAFLVEDGNITLSGSGSEMFHNHHLQQILFGERILKSAGD